MFWRRGVISLDSLGAEGLDSLWQVVMIEGALELSRVPCRRICEWPGCGAEFATDATGWLKGASVGTGELRAVDCRYLPRLPSSRARRSECGRSSMVICSVYSRPPLRSCSETTAVVDSLGTEETRCSCEQRRDIDVLVSDNRTLLCQVRTQRPA